MESEEEGKTGTVVVRSINRVVTLDTAAHVVENTEVDGLAVLGAAVGTKVVGSSVVFVVLVLVVSVVVVIVIIVVVSAFHFCSIM